MAIWAYNQGLCEKAINAVGLLTANYSREENYYLSTPIVWACTDSATTISLLEIAESRGVSKMWMEAQKLELIYMSNSLTSALAKLKDLELRLCKKLNCHEV